MNFSELFPVKNQAKKRKPFESRGAVPMKRSKMKTVVKNRVDKSSHKSIDRINKRDQNGKQKLITKTKGSKSFKSKRPQGKRKKKI